MILKKTSTAIPMLAWPALVCSLAAGILFVLQPESRGNPSPRGMALSSRHVSGALMLTGFYYETGSGRISLPVQLMAKTGSRIMEWQAKTSDGRTASARVIPEGDNFALKLSAGPADGIVKWGFQIGSKRNEYFTGLMERVIDGPQQASWAPGLQESMNLRGQKVEMLVKPTTSVYAPFYLSSRGYGLFIKTDWPGKYDFCSTDPQQVGIEFEGPSLEAKIYTASQPASLVKAHALDAGPPFLPPKWAFRPFRWRDEHTHRATYYDGTPVTGPFNSEMMEDVLMMRAYGIPCGVYWIDRPWGPGRIGYDDFEIDPRRLPNFAESVKWLNSQQTEMMLWIASFFQGRMEQEAHEKSYTLAGQQPSIQNYPLADLANPDAKAYWQSGIEKLLRLGVAAFKLDRGEEQIPDGGPYKRFDGKSIRENRNTYVAMFAQAAAEVMRKHRGEDFVAMPRGAYTGSSPHAVFWGGDIGGTEWGLRASIIAVQRAAVMGYPNWGSDTCGYNEQTLDQDMCARWLAFSCFTPIMEVGPTRNVAFWNLPREPMYDATLIAVWRLYARLHDRLAEYSYAQAQEASKTGLPIVRPLFLANPKASAAWSNWWTYLYGRDLLVSPVWEKGKRTQQVYLPSGSRWRDAWHAGKVYAGGRTITVQSDLHQIPLFVREGSNIKLGDLNREWQESVAIASRKPDLKALDSEVAAWFDGLREKTQAQLPRLEFPLWTEGAPGALGKDAKDIPTLTPYFAPSSKSRGAAVIICPGGGYGHLAPHEGAHYAMWLNEQGISGFVLKYRLATGGYRHPAMMNDVLRAIRYVRANAGKWGLDPNKIGVMGSSAGGHLASTALTHFDAGDPVAADPIDRASSRPDLGILCYPVITMGPDTHEGSRRNLLGDNPDPSLMDLLSGEKQVRKDTPPVFIFHTFEDTAVKMENTLEFAAALRRQGIPFSLHIYPKGSHGMGLGSAQWDPASRHIWTQECALWLKEQGFGNGPYDD